MYSSDFFLAFLALLFPPLPVWVKCGICSADSLINLLLCMLGYVPGLLHAWYIIAKHPEPVGYYEEHETESGRVTYVVVSQEGEEAGRRPQQQPQRQARGGRHQQARPKSGSQPGRQAHMSYGTGGNGSGAAGSSAASAAAPSLQQPQDYNGEGSEGLPPPPSYAQVMGDNKIQDRS